MYQKLLKDIPGQVYTPDQLGTYYYAFNTQRAPTNDVRVRGLSYAIDRKIIAEKCWAPAKTGLSLHAGRDRRLQTGGEFAATAIAGGAGRAGQGVAAGGRLRPNNPLKLTLLYNTSESHQKIAIAVASMWKKKLGIDVKLQNREWKTYIDSRNTGNFDVIRASRVGDYNEASTFLSLLTSTHSGNIAKFKNADYDKLLAQAGRETNPAAVTADYNKMEQIIADRGADRADLPVHQRPPDQTVGKGYPITNPEDVAYSQTMYIIKH